MMRTGIPITLLGSALLAGLLSLGGCKQNVGERCQIDDDCGTDLYCLLTGPTRDVGGYCQSTTPAPVTPVPMPDLTTPADLATTPPDMVSTTD